MDTATEIEEIMWSDDETFEKAVKNLDLRGILGLMEALQTAMRKEQLHFEDLTAQLQKYPDRNSYNHRKISAALCSTQRLLTNLCMKHMMCSGQRSLRSSFSDSCPTVESAPVVKVGTMLSGSVQNGGDRKSGFKESLKFFQSQVEKTNVPRTNELSGHTKKVQVSDHKQQIGTGALNKVNLRTTNSVPSVDNILSTVKTLCASRNGNTVGDESSSFPTVHRSASDKKLPPTIVPVVFQGSDTRRSEGVTRSEQVSASDKIAVADKNKRPSLLSNFNPVFEPDDDGNDSEPPQNPTSDKFAKDIFNSSHNSHVVYDSKKSVQKNVESLTKDFHQKLGFENINVASCLKAVNSSSSTIKQVSTCSDESTENVKHVEYKNSSIYTNRTFGQCKEKLSQVELDKRSGNTLPPNSQDVKNGNFKILETLISDITKKDDDDDESISERQLHSFESDYDSQDFVVHKANFPDDYIESEDNYSSLNEDYEVEHPEDQAHCPDIPSPDYVSDEEEYYVQHGDEVYYQDVEFIDNSAQYMNDPRRYMYYPDDKELEVIPEEDEDDIEEYEEMYSHEDSYKPGGYHVSR